MINLLGLICPGMVGVAYILAALALSRKPDRYYNHNEDLPR